MSKNVTLACKALESKDETRLKELILDISETEEGADAVFERSATEIMSVDFLNINPDYLLDIAKGFDQVSDLLERTALLLRYVVKVDDSDVYELLTTAAAEIEEITIAFRDCLSVLYSNRNKVEEICSMISEREKVVDQLRESFNLYAVQKMGMSEHRIWLKDIFGHLDLIADYARDLSIAFRVVSMKLERQRTLAFKKR
jgi:uncharacterized protein Yka (UPF0111/DUF47 family)